MPALVPLLFVTLLLATGCDGDGRSVAAESVWSGAPRPAGAEKRPEDTSPRDDEAEIRRIVGDAREELAQLMFRLDFLAARARLPEHADRQAEREAIESLRAAISALETEVNDVAIGAPLDEVERRLGPPLAERVKALKKELVGLERALRR